MIDEGITNDGDFLYSVSPNGNMDGYKISGGGSLKMMATAGATGITGVSQGLAAW